MAKRPTSPEWLSLLDSPSTPVHELASVDLPEKPGVYLWRRDGSPAYVGMATDLRGRAWRKHLGASVSLAGSSLRRNVCELLFGIPPSATSNPNRQKVTRDQAAAIKRWLLECELSWQVCDTAQHADDLETLLRSQFRPPLNRA